MCQGIADLAVKKRTESRRTLSRLAEARFPEARLFPMDTEQDAVLLLRHLGAQKQRRLAFRSRRSHMLVQSASYIPSVRQEGAGGPPTGLGTLRVSGYIRGRPLQVNRLVHVAGHGDFQLSQIDAPTDPLPIVTGTPRPMKSAKGQDVEMMVSIIWTKTVCLGHAQNQEKICIVENMSKRLKLLELLPRCSHNRLKKP